MWLLLFLPSWDASGLSMASLAKWKFSEMTMWSLIEVATLWRHMQLKMYKRSFSTLWHCSLPLRTENLWKHLDKFLLQVSRLLWNSCSLKHITSIYSLCKIRRKKIYFSIPCFQNSKSLFYFHLGRLVSSVVVFLSCTSDSLHGSQQERFQGICTVPKTVDLSSVFSRIVLRELFLNTWASLVDPGHWTLAW